MTFLRKKEVGKRAYYYLVENKRVNGKVKQQILTYYGNKKPSTLKKEDKAFSVTKTEAIYDVGYALALFQIMNEFKLDAIINEYVPKREGIDGGLCILLTAIHKLFDDNASLNNIRDWIITTPLVCIKKLNYEKLTVDNINYVFDKLMTYSKRLFPLEELQFRLFEVARQYFGLSDKEIYYDITSAYFEGDKCEIAEKGHSREHRSDKKQINIGLITTRDRNFPIFTKTFPGNTSDKKTIIEIATTLKHLYHFEDIIAIMDRGMTSEVNIQILDANQYDYVIGLSSTAKKVQELQDNISTLRIKRKGEVFQTKKGIPMHALKFIKNFFGKRRKLVLLYNETKSKEIIENMEIGIERAKKIFKSYKYKTPTKKDIDEIEKLSGYVKIIKEKDKYKLVEDEEKIKRTGKRAGKSVLLSTLDLSATETAKLYFSKDSIEKIFKFSKQYGNLRPLLRRIEQRVKVDVFISFLGYYFMAFVKNELKDKGFDITFESLMKELPRIKGVLRSHTRRNTKFAEILCQNETQKKIVKLLNLKKVFNELCC